MVHLGSVDSPVASGDVKNIVQEFWKAVGKTPDISSNGLGNDTTKMIEVGGCLKSFRI